LWQWIHNGARLADGRPVTIDLYEAIKAQEMAKLGDLVQGHAVALLDTLVSDRAFAEFLTTIAYRHLE
jgi:malate synthase